MPALRPDIVTAFRPLAEHLPGHWRSATTHADDGTELHWMDTGGDGPPVVLLHGVQVDGTTWLRTAMALEAGHRVVMPDARGHGRSGRITAPVTVAVLVDDLRAVLAAADVRAPAVVGHSMGAEIAARLATDPDAGVRGVALVDPALRDLSAVLAIDVDAPPPWMRTVFDTLRALPAQSHAQRMVTGLGLLPPGGQTEWHEVDYVAYVDAQSRFDLEYYRNLSSDDGVVATSPDIVAAIDCPILLLTAVPMMPGVDLDRETAGFTDNWRDGRHVHLPDSGHAIPADQFDRFLDVLTTFLDQDVARRTR